MSEPKHQYKVDLSWEEERKGRLHSSELNETVEVATPPPFDGGIEGVWSPEHLFISSVSSCFMTTFLAIAEYSKFAFEDLNVSATGLLGKVDGKFKVKEITLRPTLVIQDENQSGKAKRLMEKAESACLISRSVNTEIVFEPEIQVVALK
ncbi:OsmC family protein [Fodinibius saliphilus]|uniref:OsmC family protein n=1 Tax=Fodinibius saliphilus TaxID=1920650 RepID=UPI001109C30D|nr:OsmC family protein [Fodinibius saliphilus]